MLFRIFFHRNGTTTELGRLRARNTGGAVLKAYDKYKIKQAEQRYVGAHHVKKLPAPEPISLAERKAVQGVLTGLGNAMRKSL